jgi:hypothetical protein
MTDHRVAHGNHPSLGRVPDAQVTKLRLVFGPASNVPELLAAAAEALDPFDVVPSCLEYATDDDGFRLRVSFELDPCHTDIGRVLARILPRPRCSAKPTRTSRPRRAA